MEQFKFTDIIQEIEDNFECKWMIVSSPIIKREGSTKSRKDPNITRLSVCNTTLRPITGVLPYLEEVVDRCEEINLILNAVCVDGHKFTYGDILGHQFKSLEEITKEPDHQIELDFIKREDISQEPKSRIQKFKDYFNGKFR